VVKLMEAMMTYGRDDIVAWLPDGKSFVIVKPGEFVEQVLNPVFKRAKYESFVRKLHRWGFVRLLSGSGSDCFHHTYFNKYQREWATKITATTARESKALVAKSEAADKNVPSLAGLEHFIQAKEELATTLMSKSPTDST